MLQWQVRGESRSGERYATAVDEAGERLDLESADLAHGVGRMRLDLDRPSFPTFRLPEHAEALVIYSEFWNELRRIPIRPSGEPTELQFIDL